MNALLVYAGGTAYDGVRGTDQQMADRLSRLVDVLYVDPPASMLRRAGGSPLTSELTTIRPGLWRLTPAAPPAAHRTGVNQVTAALARRAVRRTARTLGRRITAVIVSGTTDILGVSSGARTLHYITDDLSAGASLLGMAAGQLERIGTRMSTRADRVAVVSPDLVERAKSLGRDATLVPNGCDSDACADVDTSPWPDDLPSELASTPVAGFVGHINGRIDLSLLEAVADGGHPLVLVGPRSEGYEPERFPALVNRPGVHWVGRKPYETMRSYLRVIDVGLTPYADSAFNRASFPLKTLEYLAAGRGVVSTDLPATRWLGAGELIRTVSPGEAREVPKAFAAAVTAELAAPRTDALASRRREFAALHDWNERVRVIAKLLDIDSTSQTSREVAG
ncbi:glycosyltransferase [Sphaerisporangium sp. NPDC088356]|uniref:glycosyltransferase n=1 Tax=Sphaerisporangium sp. NPDC088356 TaxID=3154871 RepID=UPI003418BE91